MEVALIIVGLIALGLGVVVFALLQRVSASRVEAAELGGELQSAQADRDRVGQELEAARGEVIGLEEQTGLQTSRIAELSVTNAQICERLDAAEKSHRELVANESRMKDAFKAMGAETLKSNTEQLGKILSARLADADQLSQAELDKRKQAIEQMVRPIGETLGKTREQLAQLDERVKASSESSRMVREEAARLTRALSRPEIRGQYGEVQLRRVAELAGMTSYCDFTEQVSVRDEDGQLQRPDMVVTLPNDRVIVVDAKANISAYIEAVNTDDDSEREHHMERFARHTTEQVKKLADKKYWSLFDGNSAEFVVMFVPGDHFIDAALSRNPGLLDIAAQQGVILASPSTLIGLLRAVAVGWREQALTEQAAALFELGKELHDRAATAFEHAGKLGDSIRQSVERYNRLVGSIDTRMMPTLRKFEEAGAKSGKALVEPKGVGAQMRALGSGKMEGGE